jgi:hypothetical protein
VYWRWRRKTPIDVAAGGSAWPGPSGALGALAAVAMARGRIGDRGARLRIDFTRLMGKAYRILGRVWKVLAFALPPAPAA